jgi:hypothetical protein
MMGPTNANAGRMLPGLQEWIKFYGGYSNIPPVAWARWDRLYEAYREYRRIYLGKEPPKSSKY